MLQVFYLDAAYVSNCFFFRCFLSVSGVCFKCFICLFFYVASVASDCFKSRWGVTYGMRMESGRRCEPTVGALSLKSNAVGALACSLCGLLLLHAGTVCVPSERRGASMAVALLYSAEIFLIKDRSVWHGYWAIALAAINYF
jgi:hypothetical protein